MQALQKIIKRLTTVKEANKPEFAAFAGNLKLRAKTEEEDY